MEFVYFIQPEYVSVNINQVVARLRARHKILQ